jgi:hypothetical protein
MLQASLTYGQKRLEQQGSEFSSRTGFKAEAMVACWWVMLGSFKSNNGILIQRQPICILEKRIELRVDWLLKSFYGSLFLQGSGNCKDGFVVQTQPSSKLLICGKLDI